MVDEEYGETAVTFSQGRRDTVEICPKLHHWYLAEPN
jgi:hypothetical protein